MPKRRWEKKMSEDPQNLAWRDDKSRFGKIMLEKMGWKPGRGLGKNEEGITDNLQLEANTSTQGLGFISNNNFWVAYTEEFDAISAKSKHKNSESKKRPIKIDRNDLRKLDSELITNVHRQKVPLVSQMSEEQKCGIFGKRSVNKTAEINNIKKESKESSEKPTDNKLIVSPLSANDYFAKKMRKINERRKI